ncbi:carbohydrate ABC transporter permease [Lacrimispora sphenoides]|uniref:Raffinose/stachyose/melibiose transport system permease protein n=1 Tax=Lacrimispora sphenoides JCM 1415 TaxID=1297793 RepID=A0ABY1CEX9_9FIRM|nr:carbohydrate ABC transporter permease [Lacrimispora sphenoides]SET99571.1 raffinose/stachyose/melibiose transport system permease protein [[Clostridium] sphenoides JCM 1415]SUY53070.1 putative ABC transporter permease protein ORF2 [Lacrimispora sphenoides]
MKKTESKSKLGKIIMYFYLLVMTVVFAMPMVFTLLSSVKTKLEIFSDPFALPKVPQFINYIVAWKEANMSRYFINSILQAGATVIILAIMASMAAYVLSRFDFKGNKFLLLFFTVGMMVPMHTVLVPVAYIIGALNLKNNILALILIYVSFSLPFSILVMTNFMKGVNRSLEEAAVIDGATYFQVYRLVILPLCIPALSTISIFNFLSAWNNILFPLLFINDKKLKPISLGLLNFNGERGSDYGPLMAAIVITVALPLILYLLFQEKVEGGLAAGAVKE